MRMNEQQESQVREQLGIKEVVLDYREVWDSKVCKKFAKLIEDRDSLSGTVKAITNDKKTGTLDVINSEIGNMLAMAGMKSVGFEGRPVTLAENSNSSLSKEKLLELGVSASVILAATTKKSYTYVTVGKAKATE
jgi:hypothetical protein